MPKYQDNHLNNLIYADITNARTGNIYRIKQMKSFSVEQSTTIPADGFDFTVGNKYGEVSDVISAGDELTFYIAQKPVLKGIIDDLDISYSMNGSEIMIAGRDRISIILDNDALPKTYYNLTLSQYMKKAYAQYGLTEFYVENNEKQDKIVVSPGDTEWGIIEELCREKGMFTRFDLDKIRCYYLRTDTDYDYWFSNDYNSTIKFQEINIKVSSSVKSEVVVYSDTYDDGESKTKNIKGVAKDNNIKYKRRMVTTEAELNKTSKANKKAKELLNEVNREAFVIDMALDTRQMFKVGSVAKIQIKKLDLDCFMLIDSVKYSKDISSGAMTYITFKMIEGVPIKWKNHSIPTLPKLR